jgi:hypothetical protein
MQMQMVPWVFRLTQLVRHGGQEFLGRPVQGGSTGLFVAAMRGERERARLVLRR